MKEEVWDSAVNRLVQVAKGQYKKGMETYGRPLTTFNGRSVGDDIFEELVDSAQYAQQLIMEAQAMAEVLYVYAVTYDFLLDLPVELQQYLAAAVEGQSIAEICNRRKVEFYGTNERLGHKNHTSSSESCAGFHGE